MFSAYFTGFLRVREGKKILGIFEVFLGVFEKTLEKKDRETHKKAREIGKRKKQGHRKKARIGGSGDIWHSTLIRNVGFPGSP